MNNLNALGQEMFERHEAEDEQFFRAADVDMVDPNQHSQPVMQQNSLLAQQSSGRKKLKSPTRLKAQSKTPPKMNTRKQANR